MAIRTWRGTIDSNWGTAGNWLEGAVPLVADDVIFDVTSPNCTVNTTTRVCKSINFSAYTNTITMSFGINVAATTSTGVQIILGSGMTINGGGAINIARVNTILRSNGKVWPNDLGIGTIGSLATNSIYTLQDNWVLGGSFVSGYGTGLNYTLTGGTLTVGGSFLMNGQQAGNFLHNITLTGSGTISGTGFIDSYPNLVINTSGSYTLGNFNVRSTNFIYSSGTITTTSGSTFTSLGTTTVNTNGSTSLSPPLSSSTGINFFNFSTFQSATITLPTPLCVIGDFDNAGSLLTGRNVVINGSDVYLNGGFGYRVRTVTGTSNFRFQGTGNLFSDSALISTFGPGVGNNFIINTPGTITVTGGYLIRRSGLVNVISGNVVTNNAIVMISDTFTSSFNTPNLVWGGLFLDSTFPTNRSSAFSAVTDFLVNGDVRAFQSTSGPQIYGNVYVTGSCVFNNITTGIVFGGGTLRMRGTGVLSMSGASGTSSQGYLSCNVVFESGANQIDIIGTLRFRDRTITYTSGIINTTNNTLNILAASTLNTDGMSWGTVTNIASPTITLGSTLSANTITLGSDLTFAGSFGFNTNNLNHTIPSGILTMGAGNFYYVRQSLFARGTLASRATFSSSSVSLVTYLTLENSATQDVGFTSATRIDSSLGQTIYTRKGVLTTTTNWELLTNPVTIYRSFISQ